MARDASFAAYSRPSIATLSATHSLRADLWCWYRCCESTGTVNVDIIPELLQAKTKSDCAWWENINGQTDMGVLFESWWLRICVTISNLMNNVFSTFGFQQFARRALPATLPCYFVSLIPSQGFNNLLCPVHASQALDRWPVYTAVPAERCCQWHVWVGWWQSTPNRG